jgi:hypothetical protein
VKKFAYFQRQKNHAFIKQALCTVLAYPIHE